jgi:hypothetical protein
MRPRTSAPIAVAAFKDSSGVELAFSGIEQAGPSFEGRVFLNRPDADESTPLTPTEGYAGSFHVYGYGTHPPPALAEEKRERGPGGTPVAPIEKRLKADDEALHQALEASDELRVTVVPVPVDPGGALPERPFENVEIVFDPAR